MNRNLSMESLSQRFPRLSRHMRRAACLTSTEAVSAIRDCLNGQEWSGEAVNHFGGVSAVIRHAIARRHLNNRFRMI